MPLSTHLLAFLDIGGGEMMVIFIIVLLLFGGQRMPELARGIGKSLREFKKVTSGVEDQIKQAIDEAPEKTPAASRKVVVPIAPVPPATPPTPALPPAANTSPDPLVPPSTPPETTP